MKRTLLITISYLAAGAAAIVPAIIGLAGNPSFSQQLPVRAPDNARPVTVVATDNPRPVHDLRRSDSFDERSRDRREAADGPGRARKSHETERRDNRRDDGRIGMAGEPGDERRFGRRDAEHRDDRGGRQDDGRGHG